MKGYREMVYEAQAIITDRAWRDSPEAVEEVPSLLAKKLRGHGIPKTGIQFEIERDVRYRWDIITATQTVWRRSHRGGPR